MVSIKMNKYAKSESLPYSLYVGSNLKLVFVTGTPLVTESDIEILTQLIVPENPPMEQG